ncbi:MAG: hypothetical protein GQF41_3426 [Candidatus Rifleibacterium amylolyticum]|nr:MAG: hypothetical protein GQF41_3426 [Candidatus Rifleibacterium amylolyticum]
MQKSPAIDSQRRPLFVRFLLFWLHPVVLVALILLVSSLLFVPSLMLISTPVNLPEFAGPEQEDFWSLQKKMIDVNQSASPLKLTPSEFNAFLSGCQIPPEGGFCLQRLRYLVNQDHISLYVIGSGFFMRSLVFQIDLKSSATSLQTAQIKINSLELDASHWFAEHVIDYLKRLASRNAESSLARILAGKGNIEFLPDGVVLQGEFMPTRPKTETEELPVVEIEEMPAEN